MEDRTPSVRLMIFAATRLGVSASAGGTLLPPEGGTPNLLPPAKCVSENDAFIRIASLELRQEITFRAGEHDARPRKPALSQGNIGAQHLMRKFFQKVKEVMRSRYDPNPVRRAEVIRLLQQRPSLSAEAWQCRFAPDVPVDFVRWFRDMCSKNFEFDLSGALPEDRMREDLGMNDATWGDVSWDIEEDFEEHFGVKLPDKVEPPITTFGQLLEFLWKYAQAGNHCK